MHMIKAIVAVACVFGASLSVSTARAEDCLIPFVSKTARCPMSVDQGKVKVKLTPAQIKASISAIRKTSDDHITNGLYKGPIFDAQVLGTAPSVAGQPTWKLKILHNYQGEQDSGECTVVTPAVKDGGATLVVGKKYRIYTVVVGDKFDVPDDFYVWKGSVVGLP
ncbi:hypothetical protein [Rhodanobacter sp. MP1X3]|uniref:hypothetical protein n=1 Tax=Rhodanobacter sp. MP1X3 TaxID=2723086 RepID=UPI001616B2AD|nr:hypothetical protein [Rhodanobacter sp. MP1X3]MBB6243154.1 hypothetical protein [Rhodanobacter sp. MP1X3]